MNNSERTQAMLYLAQDLIEHKQYHSTREKIAIKCVLEKYLSAGELEAIAKRYDNAPSRQRKWQDIPEITLGMLT